MTLSRHEKRIITNCYKGEDDLIMNHRKLYYKLFEWYGQVRNMAFDLAECKDTNITIDELLINHAYEMLVEPYKQEI